MSSFNNSMKCILHYYINAILSFLRLIQTYTCIHRFLGYYIHKDYSIQFYYQEYENFYYSTVGHQWP